MDKANILAFTKYYLPGYRAGGPVRTLANMVGRLGDELDFMIVTSDRDMADEVAYPGVTIDAWNEINESSVFYASPGRRSIWGISYLMREVAHDAVYLNSFLDPTFTQRVLWARKLRLIPQRPIILAPRGEFSAGAWALKRRKKEAYLKASRLLGLYQDLTWQASSELEAAAIRVKFPEAHIVVAANLAPASDTAVTQPWRTPREPGDPLRVCFLSRISPMKNLDYVFKVLRGVKVPVEFTVYGPVEVAEYWAMCQSLAAALPVNVEFKYRGGLEPEQVGPALRGQDLFFLPSRGENYGHVIHEALTAGLPVLISDQTPWQDLESAGVGWALPLSDKWAYAQVIDEVGTWSEEEHQAAARRAAFIAAKKVSNESDLHANCRLFEGVLGRIKPPLVTRATS